MQYQGTLIAVSDIAKSKHFYETIMDQKILMDLGVHVSFDRGLSLQSNYAELVGEELKMQSRPNNFQLYFEVDDLDYWQEKIKAIDSIEFIHEAKEYPWGQRVMRFYDYDQYIVEVSESMVSVAKRFLSQGLSVEETAQRTMYPVDFVKSLL
ncbi:MAG: glyoxalase/bleomycin resistance/dioxygenase family protein [Clostridiaceae bacterium]|jgi:predicted enzyme related to lactoylglutathione lyase|nr:glyoxalase/bleomycin resistance/dioxygenase family protein [Clostridiaceae bacterium]